MSRLGSEIGIADPYLAVRRNMNVMVDGLGWQPLSTEVDYMQVFDRVQNEVFADELELAAD